MALKADKRDYQNAFHKHFAAYNKWSGTENDLTKRLILVYCVECGLKYKILDQTGVFSSSDAQEDVQKLLSSHNIKDLLKFIRWTEPLCDPKIKTHFHENVSVSDYHQYCRYAIKTEANVKTNEAQFVHSLDMIAQFLRDEV